MSAAHPLASLRVLTSLATLALLAAALFLLPSGAQAQNMPVISGDATASVPENTATTTVIKTYMASDADSDPLTWTLEGDDASDFTLTANSDDTGYELKFASVPDYEMPAGTPATTGDPADNTYEVTVKVEDDETNPMTGMLEVIVTVTNVNETPSITTTTSTITKPENTATTEVLETYEASDPDASPTFTWTLEGEDAATSPSRGTLADTANSSSGMYPTTRAQQTTTTTTATPPTMPTT